MIPRRLRPPAAALLIAGLTLLFFWKILFTNLILIGVDSFLYFYPYKAYVAQALSAGRLPLWNPHLFMGVPLLANMQTAVLYPLNWPFLSLSPPKQVAASIALHVALAGWGTHFYARRSLRLGWFASLTAAIVFALGGFVGAQAEHINQLNVMAWLPWTFLLLDVAVGNRRRLTPVLGLGLVMAMMILAGHAQATYICWVGLGFYAIAGGRRKARSPGSQVQDRHRLAALGSYLRSRLPYLLALAIAVGVAILLSAMQILPTWELSRLSVRSGGLSYREAAAFSLRPWQLHHSLLPPFGSDLSQVFGEAYSEYVAYVGVFGLSLAAWGVVRGWRRLPSVRFFTLFSASGLFLGIGGFNPVYYALYLIIPGFNLFRVPARWMLFYAFGIAVLAGIGMNQISNAKYQISNMHSPIASRQPSISRFLSPLLLALLVVELFLASQGLRYNQPTAPEAFTFLRPSIAHLKTDPGPHRFLSLSGIVYDPGDLPEIQAMFADQLSEKAIYNYVVAAKEKEVLFYNLPLLYGLYSVDGYDGGLLPLRDFVTLERLFLDEERLSIDGRLRENLREVPPGRLLSLLGAKYVITDKVFDVWIDGLFYDLEFSARLSRGGTPTVGTKELPDFPTTALGVISHLVEANDLPDGSPVARITIADETGWSETFELQAGRDTSQGRYDDQVAHRMAQVGHTWRDDPSGKDYVALLPLDAPRRLKSISVTATHPSAEFVLRGLSLVDSRTNTTRQVTLSTQGTYRPVHSGDVKIYQNMKVLPRAFVVHQTQVLADDEKAIARLRDPAFDPATIIVLAKGETLKGEGQASAQIIKYAPEHVVVQATTDTPGYLLLTDTHYPGWEATVDGEPAQILRADILFRAVQLEPGTHHVEFRFRPASVRWGAWISASACLLWLTGFFWSVRRRD